MDKRGIGWRPEALAALWPQHGLKPERGWTYLPRQTPPAACLVGVLALHYDVLDEYAPCPTLAHATGYPLAWCEGLMRGFDERGALDEEWQTVDFAAGYALGQQVAALVFAEATA